MVLIAPDSTLHLSEMLTLPPQTVLSLIASERRNARSAINTIQAERSVVENDDIRNPMPSSATTFPSRWLAAPSVTAVSRASLSYTGIHRHATDTRIGLMGNNVPVEAMMSM